MYMLQKFIEEKSTWSKLKAIENSKIVQSMYVWLLIVPLTAKFFSKIENTLHLTISGNTYEFDLVLPFTWVIFFFSALSFTLANIIFISVAPLIIKENDNYGDFTNSGRDQNHLVKYIDNIQKDDAIDLIKEKWIRIGNRQLDLKLDFWEIYNKANKNKLIRRYLCFLFYIVGLVLFLLVAVQNIKWVINEMVF